MSVMSEEEFKDKARRQIFNSRLAQFPVVFELYVRAFNIECDRDEAMAQIVSVIRTSENQTVAYTLVCHYLDELEEKK